MSRQLLDLKSKAAIEFICPLCLNLPKNPVKCLNIFCQGIFCLNCVKDRIGKPNNQVCQCPYRCSIVWTFQIQDINQFELRYYDNFESACNYCNQNFSLLKYRKHNDKCENKINKKLNLNNEEKQQKQCQYCHEINKEDKFQCLKCNLQVKIQFSQNCEVDLYDKQCQFCLQFFDNKVLDSHIQNYCLEFQVQCEICGIRLLRKNYNDHSKSCIKLQKNKLEQDQIYYTQISKMISLNIQQKQIEITSNVSKWIKIEKKISNYKQQNTDDES